jgi:hypothetical protein
VITISKLAQILAKDYEGAITLCSDEENKVTLHYKTGEAAEAAHDAIADLIDSATQPRINDALAQILTKDMVGSGCRCHGDMNYFMVTYANSERCHSAFREIGKLVDIGFQREAKEEISKKSEKIKAGEHLMLCRKCDGPMRPSKATKAANVIDKDGNTQHRYQLIDCMKCTMCGWSVT